MPYLLETSCSLVIVLFILRALCYYARKNSLKSFAPSIDIPGPKVKVIVDDAPSPKMLIDVEVWVDTLNQSHVTYTPVYNECGLLSISISALGWLLSERASESERMMTPLQKATADPVFSHKEVSDFTPLKDCPITKMINKIKAQGGRKRIAVCMNTPAPWLPWECCWVWNCRRQP